MAWGNPQDPVAGTVITVAWAVANVLNPLRHLRLMTGNADPPGAWYALVSTGGGLPQWIKIPTDAIADLAITNGKLATDAVDDRVLAAGAAAANLPGSSVPGQLQVSHNRSPILASFVRSLDNAGVVHAILIGGPSYQYLVGNVAAQWPWCVMDTGYNVLIGLSSDGQVYIGGSLVWNSGNFSPAGKSNVGHTHPGSDITDGSLAEVKLDVTNAPFGGGFMGWDVATGKMQWQSPAAVAGVPSGAIVLFRTAEEIPAGYTRESNLDGRIAVGAGTTFGQTFVQGTNYGTSWTPTVGNGTLGINNTQGVNSSLGINDTIAINDTTAIGAATDVTTNKNVTGGSGDESFVGQHSHAKTGGVSKTGTVALTGTVTLGGSVSLTGSVTANAYVPPTRAYVYARRN